MQLLSSTSTQLLARDVEMLASYFLTHPDQSSYPQSLCTGATGKALFLGYYYKHTGDEAYLAKGISIIEELFEKLETSDTDRVSFSLGLAGMVWTFNHFIQQDILEVEDDVLEVFDDFLYRMAQYELKERKYDYLHGALGYMLVLLERYPFKPELKSSIEEFLPQLLSISYSEGESIYWRDPSVTDYVSVNFGLAHGLPSILVFLAYVYEKGIAQELCLMTAKGIIQYMQQHRQEGRFCVFPSVYDIGRGGKDSRVGWCYGDLGIAVAFYQAGSLFGMQEWVDEGFRIALATTKRKTPEETLVIDGGLCHGHAGISHIYTRLYEYYQDPVFKEASEYWLKELLQFVEAQGGIMNYKEHRGEAGWYECDSLLGGSAGIALVLLNQYSNVPPNWDRMFLLS